METSKNTKTQSIKNNKILDEVETKNQQKELQEALAKSIKHALETDKIFKLYSYRLITPEEFIKILQTTVDHHNMPF